MIHIFSTNLIKLIVREKDSYLGTKVVYKIFFFLDI
jgi:hypothetical protein